MFGQFPAKRHPARFPGHRAKIAERGQQAVRRLVQKDGARLGRDSGQALSPFLSADRQKALENETVGGKPRQNQRQHRGAGSGHGCDGDLLGRAKRHQIRAGIADGGVPASLTNAQEAPLFKRATISGPRSLLLCS